MEFHWNGWLPAFFLGFISLFTIVMLFVLYKIMQIISKSFEQKFQSKIAKPIFSVLAYSIVWMTFKQYIVFKVVVLTNPFLEDWLEIFFNLAYVVLVFVVLFKVLRDSQKEIKNRNTKMKSEVEKIEAELNFNFNDRNIH